MRILKFLVWAVIVLVGLSLLCAYLYLKTLDVNRFRPECEERLSRWIGRPVHIDFLEFRFAVLKPARLFLNGVTISETEEGKDPLLTVDQVELTASISKILLQRRPVFSKVRVHRPRLEVTWPREGTRTEEDKEVDDLQTGPVEGTLPDLFIEELRVEKGRVLWKGGDDGRFGPVELTDVGLVARDVTPAEPYSIEGTASYLDGDGKWRWAGRMRVDWERRRIRFDDMKVETSLALSSADGLAGIFPAAENTDVAAGTGARIRLKISRMVVDAEGIALLACEGRLDKGRLNLLRIPVPFTEVTADFTWSQQDLEVRQWSARFGIGTMQGRLRLTDYAGARRFKMEVRLDDINLRQLFYRLSLPVDVVGLLDTRGRFQWEGWAPASLQRTLRGDGSFTVHGGKFPEVNVPAMVLNRFTKLPDLTSRLVQGHLPRRYARLLQGKGTAFDRFGADFTADEQGFHFDDVHLSAEMFDVRGGIDVSWNGRVEARGTLWLSASLASNITARVKPLESLLDDDGRMRILLKPYSGPWKGFSIEPDPDFLDQRIILNRNPPPPNEVALPEGFAPQRSAVPATPEEKQIRGILDSVF